MEAQNKCSFINIFSKSLKWWDGTGTGSGNRQQVWCAFTLCIFVSNTVTLLTPLPTSVCVYGSNNHDSPTIGILFGPLDTFFDPFLVDSEYQASLQYGLGVPSPHAVWALEPYAISKSDFEIEGFGEPIHLDRDSTVAGKSHGGALSLDMNKKWWNTIVIRETLCTPDTEQLSVFLHPSYLLREFLQLFMTLVYIHPKANVDRASQAMVKTMQQLHGFADSTPSFVMGEFNHCRPGKSLSHIYQSVTCSIWLTRCSDLCCRMVKDAYKLNIFEQSSIWLVGPQCCLFGSVLQICPEDSHQYRMSRKMFQRWSRWLLVLEKTVHSLYLWSYQVKLLTL